MAVPTVGANLVAGGTSAAGTTVVLTLTAAVPVGDVLMVVTVLTASQTVSISDSKGNTWVAEIANFITVPQGYLNTCLVTKALVIGDTITITAGATVQGASAAMLQLTGVPQNQINLGAYAGFNTFKSATSTSASSNVLSTTRSDDCIFLLVVGAFNSTGQVLSTDFSLGSVDSSYTKADFGVSAGGTTGCGVCLCYKTVVATPASQSPTFTLNASRNWSTFNFMFSGLTARGAIGTWLRTGDIASAVTSYKPHANDVLGKVKYGQIAKSPFDGAPQPAITPQEPRVGVQVSDGLLSSE